MTKQLIYNTLFFKKEVVLELIQNSTSDLKVYVINISQGPKYYRMTSVYQFINKIEDQLQHKKICRYTLSHCLGR